MNMTKTKKMISGIFLMSLFIIPSVALAQWNVGNVSGFSLPSGSIYKIIENLLYWFLSILGFVGIIGFVVSGIMYLISTGDDDMIKRAKKGMTASIVGVIVGLAGVVVIQAISVALSGTSFGF
jgi:hypothetical protein